MAEPSNEQPVSRTWLGVTLALTCLLFLTSVLTALLWHLARMPTVAMAVLALIFGAMLIKRKDWARGALLVVVLVQLAVSLTILLPVGLLLPLLLQVVCAAWLIVLLIGARSTRKAWISCAGVIATALLGGYLLVSMASGGRGRAAVLESAQRIHTFHSPAQYNLLIGDMPWSVLGQREAAELLGADIENADLRLVRDNATGFALFFPLRFRNMEYSPEIAALLQKEIQGKWLHDLEAWSGHPQREGFILTAQGNTQGLELSYIVMYKHFGNLGVYAIVWGERRYEPELLAETSRFYEQLSAPPVKQRLTTLSPGEIYRKFSDAVVLINVYDEQHKLLGKGTGFNVSPNGLILTNLHVILPGHYLQVVFPNGATHDEVRIAGLSQHGADIALLAIEDEGLPIIQEVRSVSVDPGDAVFVLGNPKGLVNSVSEGIVGAIRQDENIVYYQITAPISVGSSGGPVFNQYGEVIGIATAVVEDAQNLNFSISIDEVQHLAFLPLPMSLLQLRQELEEYQRGQ